MVRIIRDICWLILCLLAFVTFVAVEDAYSAGYNPDSYVSTSFGMGKNMGNDWNDAGVEGTFLQIAYTKRLKGNLFGALHWTHLSQLRAGSPFNNDAESHVDHFGIKLEGRW